MERIFEAENRFDIGFPSLSIEHVQVAQIKKNTMTVDI
jgi:hypothetical protein